MRNAATVCLLNLDLKAEIARRLSAPVGTLLGGGRGVGSKSSRARHAELVVNVAGGWRSSLCKLDRHPAASWTCWLV